MYQMAAAVWNQIAREQSLLTPMANKLFPLSQYELDAELERRSEQLQSDGIAPSVISAYLQLAPLLWENEAIQAFVIDHYNVAPGLPSVESLDEAMLIARRDRPLDEEEQAQLRRLLMRRPI